MCNCVPYKRERYFLHRGFNRFLANELGQMVIWSWLVTFFVFAGTCVDYGGIMAVRIETSLWDFVNVSQFGTHWFFLTSLIL